MNGLASSRVSSVEEAARALEYYNGFHDGFMKRIVIDSRDEIHADLGQSCTGVFDVEIDFAHYNYRKGAEPFLRTTRSFVPGSETSRISSATLAKDSWATRSLVCPSLP